MAQPLFKIEYDPAVLRSNNQQIQRAARNAMRNTINKRITDVIKTTISETAQEAGLPQKNIRNRYGNDGKISSKRLVRQNATTRRLQGSITVYLRGIPLGQVVQGGQRARNKGIVKARGRVYKGAFFRDGKVYYGRPKQRGLYLPKIGVRERLLKKVRGKLFGNSGQRAFEKLFDQNMNKQVARLNRA